MRQAPAPAPAASGASSAQPCPKEEHHSKFLDGDQWLTWILVFAGWIAVHKLSVLRARRQEDLKAIDSIESRVAAVRDLAIEYYTTPRDAKTPSVESRMKQEVQSIVRAIDVLQRGNRKRYVVTPQIASLRQAVTGGDFETKRREPVEHNHARVLGLWDAADSLVHALRKCCDVENKHG